MANSLQDSILYWESQLKETKDQIERAVLSEKIANAKKQIEKDNIVEEEKKVSTIIDAAPICDRLEVNDDTVFNSVDGKLFAVL